MSIKNIKKTVLFGLFLFLIFPVLSQAEVIRVRVILQNAHVNLKPELDSMIIVSVPAGTELESTDKTDDWFKVKLPPNEQGFVVTGYIHGSMVEVIVEKSPQKKEEIPRIDDSLTPVKKDPHLSQNYRDRQSRTSKMEFGLRLYGMGSYFKPDDINEGLEGLKTIYHLQFDELPNFTFSGGWEPLHFNYGGGLEFYFLFSPRVGMGIGVGYLNAVRQFDTNWAYDSWYARRIVDRYDDIKIMAIPIDFNLYYGLLLGKNLNIFLKGGLAYYFGKFQYDGVIEGSYVGESSTFQPWFWTAKKGFLGFHAGFELDVNLGRNIALFLSSCGRMAATEDLKGLYDYEIYRDGVLNSDVLEERTLWFAELVYEDVKYSGLRRSVEKPEGPEILDVRKAKLNLSGVSLQVGLKVKFSIFKNGLN